MRSDTTTDGTLASSHHDADVLSDRWRWWAIHILLVAAWIATHPYFGIVHDGRLYVVQALKAADPSFLADDLYFAFGSQDSFTRFSAIYAVLVSRTGPAVAHWISTVAGQLVWLPAMLFLLRTLFGSGREFVAGAAAVIVLAPYYGGQHTFGYGEPFATPRLYVEALVMTGVALQLRRRPVGAGLCMAAGMLLHPLMALPGIAILGLLAALQDRRVWLAGLIALGAAFTLAVAGIDPFSRVLQRFEGAWFDVVRQRSSFAFVARWTWLDLADLASKAAMGIMAWRVARPVEQRLIAVVGAVAAGGFAATILGSDLAANVLITNVQPWRALWIATVLANAWMIIVACRLPQASVSRHLLILALVCSVAYRLVGLVDVCSPALVVLACLISFAPTQPLAMWRGVLLVAPAIAVVLVGFSAAIAAGVVAQLAGFPLFERRLAAAAVGAGAIGLLSAVANERMRHRKAIIAVGLALLAAAMPVADRRSDWTKFVEDEAVPPDLADFVRDSGTTYWEGNFELLWLKLRRQSYYSCVQGTGSMFYPGTAHDYHRRGVALSALDTADFARDAAGDCTPKQNPRADGPASRDQLVTACRALPDLDTLVLLHAVPGAAAATWQSPVPYVRVAADLVPEKITTFHKYQCAELR
jgi:hypothetical protein